MRTPRIIGAREFETTDPSILPDMAESLGPNHAPTPHRTSAYAMLEAIDSAGLTLKSQIHVVDGLRTMRREGGGNYGEITVPNAHLFSLYTVWYGEMDDLLIGYRNSVAQSMARRCCVGKSFPICSNVSLFGEDIVFNAKNTVGQTDIFRIAREGVQEKVLPLFRTIEEQLEALRNRTMVGDTRTAEQHKLFLDGTLPVRYLTALDDVLTAAKENRTDDNGVLIYPEVTENIFNALGVMHAATRVIQDKGIRQQATLSQKISKHFGFGVAA